MITAVVGAGGKTTLIHQLAARYRWEGKRVLVVTSTHMLIEQDTLLTDDPRMIQDALDRNGYAMAGTPCGKRSPHCRNLSTWPPVPERMRCWWKPMARSLFPSSIHASGSK